MNHSQNSIPMTKLGRMIPLAFTVIWIWLGWRWLRIKRKLFGDKRMEKSTHEFHKNSALSVVRQAIRQQGLIIKTCQYLGSRADRLLIPLRPRPVRLLSMKGHASSTRPGQFFLFRADSAWPSKLLP